MENIETDSKIPDDLSRPLKVGDIVEGKIIGAGRSSIYLDLAPYGTGIIYGREFYEGKDTLKELGIGDTLSAKIIELDNDEGFVELSVSKAEEELAWRKLTQKKEKDETVEVKILGANKGGLLTTVSGIQAFLPVSQLSSEHYPYIEGGDQTEILKELKKFVGIELEVKILDISRKERKLILSEKAKEIKKMKELLKGYEVGDIVEGEITAVLDFGAFIRFPLIKKDSENNTASETLEGLIHISELDWQLIEDPSEIVKVGEKVKAQITKISNGKVSLSLKSLKKDPWEDFSKEHKTEETISGKVTKFNDFGAFVQVDDKIQGLCHISEFGSQEKMKDALKIGEKYNFEILSLEPKEHRLTLKLKGDQ